MYSNLHRVPTQKIPLCSHRQKTENTQKDNLNVRHRTVRTVPAAESTVAVAWSLALGGVW